MPGLSFPHRECCRTFYDNTLFLSPDMGELARARMIGAYCLLDPEDLATLGSDL